jgi:hypothetical protein
VDLTPDEGQQTQRGVADHHQRNSRRPKTAPVARQQPSGDPRQQWAQQREQIQEQLLLEPAPASFALAAGAVVHRRRREPAGALLNGITRRSPATNQEIGHVILARGVRAEDEQYRWRGRQHGSILTEPERGAAP